VSDTTGVRLPGSSLSPIRIITQRLLIAVGILILVGIVVYADHNGYTDSADGTVSPLDALYYSTVTLSTTGYGDITPVSDSARLINILVVTPLRILFLIVLVGTTIEALTTQSRMESRARRWRDHVQDHTVILGFGTKGRAAAQSLLDHGVPGRQLAVIDPDPLSVAEANRMGLVAVQGDATRSGVLQRAHLASARTVVVATDRDDTSVLATLTARRLNASARIVATARESENGPLLEQSGADSVITSSSAAGQLLGLAATSPVAGALASDLLVPGAGLEIAEREITPAELGTRPEDCDDLVLAVIRDDVVHRFDEGTVRLFNPHDRVVVVRRAKDQSAID
jgi:voltage-gated potassium channel